MLARRIIPLLLNRRGTLVKGRGFAKSRVIGHTRQAVRVFQARSVDELVLLDVSGERPDVDLVRDLAGECFMPLAVGGGIASLEDAAALIANGADKVVIRAPDLIGPIARRFGAQAVVVHVLDTDPPDTARAVVDRGAGEILLTSVARDGTMAGYDLDLIDRIAASVPVPVIAAGGAGTYEHLDQALGAGADAVAAGAMWTFTDQTPAAAADRLGALGWPVRRRRAA